jgi:hypothetical protein
MLIGFRRAWSRLRAIHSLHAGSGLVDDVLVSRARTDQSPGQPLRTAAIGGLGFTGLYLTHRLL